MDTAKILKLVGGASAAAFVAYCFYFDYKRRNAPDYQEKIKQSEKPSLQGATSLTNPFICFRKDTRTTKKGQSSFVQLVKLFAQHMVPS